MTAALSVIVILAIAVWFFQTAQRLGLPAVAWSIAGVIVYYGGFLFWMQVVLRSILGQSFHTHGFWLGIGMDVSSILVGAICAALFRYGVLMKKGRKPFETSF
ncbi:hypothetical protein [Methylocaldum szegediense]|uniref:Uncharacterized protein n=1 Tax=Methylocaldum szegediense TaxID=73780 RepID=A0ABN8X557_9GAMM|nr:hypothetical protein [Methylocaldum szegediense]CAI8876355.1 conserved membrane protein of unknown function [Methylocaldum szegediense]